MAVSFEAILKILRDASKTEFQKAADLHALMGDAGETDQAPAPKATRAYRKRPATQPVNGAEHVAPAETLPGLNE